jgi:hypothetical protein
VINFCSNKISNRNEIANSAKCLAAFTYSWGLNTQSSVENAVQPVVEQFMSDVESSQIESVEQFALLALGEIGSKVPLGEVVVKHQLQQFTRASESVKMSAAIGIGLVTSGNLAQLMPLLLNSLSSCDSPQISYLTLVSIREATKNASDDTLRPFANDLFTKLQEHADASEEGSRNVLAECLGRIVSVEPSLCVFLQVRSSLISILINLKGKMFGEGLPYSPNTTCYCQKQLSLEADRYPIFPSSSFRYKHTLASYYLSLICRPENSSH